MVSLSGQPVAAVMSAWTSIVLFAVVACFPLAVSQSCATPGCIPLPPSAPDASRYRIGVMANNVGSTPLAVYTSVMAQWTPMLATYLQSTVGVNPLLGRSLTFEVVPIDVSTNDLTLGYKAWSLLPLNPPVLDAFLANAVTVVCAGKELQARPVVSMVQLRGGADSEGSGATIITAQTSTLTAVGDVAGRTIVIGDPTGNLPTQAIWALLKQSGVYLFDAPTRIVQASSIAKLMPDILAGNIDGYIIRPDFINSWNSNVANTPSLAGQAWVLGTNMRFVQATNVFADYPFPSSTPEIADWGLAALPGANETVTQLIAAALMALNRTSPASLAAGVSRFTYPYDYSATAANLVDTGLAPGGVGTCLKGTSTLVNIYNAVQCPVGKYKLTLAEVAGSCAANNVTCPWAGATCICSPCRTVPDAKVSVYIAVGATAASAAAGVVNGSSNTPPASSAICSKLSVCATVHQLDVVTVSIVDRYGVNLRSSLGLAQVTTVEYLYTATLDAAAANTTSTAATAAYVNVTTSAWGVGMAAPGVGGLWQFRLPSPRLGYWLLLVRVNGVPLPDSPAVLQGVSPTCSGAQQPTAVGACACPDSVWGTTVPVDPTSCQPMFSVPGLIGGLLAAGIIVVAAVAGAIVAARARAARLAAEHWRVPYSHLSFDDVNPEVIGRGATGIVIKARYRGTVVALKRIALPRDDATTRRRGSATGRGLQVWNETIFDLKELELVEEEVGHASTLHATTSSSATLHAPEPSVASGSLADVEPVSSMKRDWASATTVESNRCESSENSVTEHPPPPPPAFAVVAPEGLGTLSSNALGSLSVPPLASFPLVPARGQLHPDLYRALIATRRRGRGRRVSTMGAASGRMDRRSSTALGLNSLVPGGIDGGGGGGGTISGFGTGTLLAQRDSFRRRDSAGEGGGRVSGSMALGASLDPGIWGGLMRLCGLGPRRWGARAAAMREAFLAEIAQVVHLRHPKIVTVMGAVLEDGHEPILLLEFMERGSLEDGLLANATMAIDADLVIPIIRDVALGMNFLHQAKPPVLHNDLKAANILIDASFAAKVSDFGLSRPGADAGLVGTPFYMSPELLRGEKPSTKSDVYAFGITLYEIFTRASPYADGDDDMLAVLTAVADSSLRPPRRPWGPAMAAVVPPVFADLIRRCTMNEPEARPSFDQISTELAYLDAPSLADTFLSRKKASNVLAQVFPPRVAAALKEGRAVEPETYPETTIFFSDIVGFTTLSQRLSAEEVMGMLDRLYTAFDELCAEHGLFKVETIGDAYLAIGGLPEPQEDHAARVARFALAACTCAGRVEIKAAGDASHGFVQIRAGFHSGPVVGSVVGRQNPKFTLFGDAVNVASRMESHGKPGRVHVSRAAADALHLQAPDLALHHLISRGKISIKGKGDMETFWLWPTPIAQKLRSRSNARSGGHGVSPTPSAEFAPADVSPGASVRNLRPGFALPPSPHRAPSSSLHGVSSTPSPSPGGAWLQRSSSLSSRLEGSLGAVGAAPGTSSLPREGRRDDTAGGGVNGVIPHPDSPVVSLPPTPFVPQPESPPGTMSNLSTLSLGPESLPGAVIDTPEAPQTHGLMALAASPLAGVVGDAPTTVRRVELEFSASASPAGAPGP